MDGECFSDSNLRLFAPFTGATAAATYTADYAALTPVAISSTVVCPTDLSNPRSLLLTAQENHAQNGLYTVLTNGSLCQSTTTVPVGAIVLTTKSNAAFVAGADRSFTNTSCATGPRAVQDSTSTIGIDPSTVVSALALDGRGEQVQRKMQMIATECVAKSWNTVSDLALKTDVQLVKDATRTLERIRGYTFDWKDGSTAIERARSSTGEYKEYGLIAQEIQTVIPSAVAQTGTTLSVSYSSLIPILVEAVRELSDRVTRLEANQPVP
jgi:hypothetical protein